MNNLLNNPEKNKTVVVALSGGIDSSVSALLLKQQGYRVIGLHAICYDTSESFCTSEKDRLDAIKIAKQLDIDISIVDLQKEFKQSVIDYLINEYKNNRTPNPDVLCNRDIKFKILFNYAIENLNADLFATGHYVKIEKNSLKMPLDKSKDQTYFLWMIDKNILSKLIFPLQDLQKNKVRQIAKSNNLFNADKKDSQGICFVGNVGIFDFLQDKIKSEIGDVVDIEGKKIGSHKGFQFYTIGQRHGFDITISSPNVAPLYVYKKIADKNILVVAKKEYLFTDEITLDSLNIFTNLDVNKKYKIRIRHLGELIECSITLENNNIKVKLDIKVFAVAPGQSAVLYDNEVVAAGGIIV